MFKPFSLACLICTSLAIGYADDPGLTPQEVPLAPAAHVAVESEKKPVERKTPPKAPVVRPVFSPFTGKIKGDKTRVRLQPDLEGHIVRELPKQDLVSVIGEEGNFWAIEVPENTKAYVFRSYVLDNVVEGNRVNVRLEPDLEAPVIGHLSAGDRVKGEVSTANKKWLEIAPPAGTKFYVAKELVEFAGGPDLKAQLDKRKKAVHQLFESASLVSKAELQKPFEEIDFERVKHSYQTIINDYSDFSDFAEKAKEALTQTQESYLQKRIAFLESKAGKSGNFKSNITALTMTEPQSSSDRMKMWEPIEEALYLSWARTNEAKNQNDYAEAQKVAATRLSGILEAFSSHVKNRPGDYVLKDKNLPVAYLYSTQIDLQNYVGKQVTLVAAPRPNNHFAFPAYYVTSVE